MTFGRDRGRPVSELETNYIRWLLANVRFRSRSLRRALEEELRRRDDDERDEVPEPEFERDLPEVEVVEELIALGYRAAALRHHPDRSGGSHERMQEVNRA